MKVHIYSAKAKSQAGNIRVKYIMTTQKRPKPKQNQLGILGIASVELTYYVGNSAEGFRSWRECCWGYVSILKISLFVYFCLIFV